MFATSDVRVGHSSIVIEPSVSGPRFVFISYSHSQDKTYADRLAAYLVSAGIEIWYDGDLVSGDRWTPLIESQITSCAAMIVIMSPASRHSVWVARELALAQKLDKPIVPLLLAGTEFFQLGELQHENVVGGRMPNAALVARLHDLTVGYATEPPPSAPVAPAGRPPTTLGSRMRATVWCFAASALLAAVLTRSITFVYVGEFPPEVVLPVILTLLAGMTLGLFLLYVASVGAISAGIRGWQVFDLVLRNAIGWAVMLLFGAYTFGVFVVVVLGIPRTRAFLLRFAVPAGGWRTSFAGLSAMLLLGVAGWSPLSAAPLALAAFCLVHIASHRVHTQLATTRS
jgi:hypothetical protein